MKIVNNFLKIIPTSSRELWHALLRQRFTRNKLAFLFPQLQKNPPRERDNPGPQFLHQAGTPRPHRTPHRCGPLRPQQCAALGPARRDPQASGCPDPPAVYLLGLSRTSASASSGPARLPAFPRPRGRPAASRLQAGAATPPTSRQPDARSAPAAAERARGGG